MGFFSLAANWLALFDFRNMPMFPFASGQSNMETLTHEATHQLCFNTGLLEREADIPTSIVEGLAMYCERRRLFGRSEPGQPNLRRLEELAHIRRRRAVDRRRGAPGRRPRLFPSQFGSDDPELRRELAPGLSPDDRIPMRLPQFRAYLKVTPHSERLALAGWKMSGPISATWPGSTRKCGRRRSVCTKPCDLPDVTRTQRSAMSPESTDDRPHPDERRARRAAPPRLPVRPHQGAARPRRDHAGIASRRSTPIAVVAGTASSGMAGTRRRWPGRTPWPRGVPRRP